MSQITDQSHQTPLEIEAPPASVARRSYSTLTKVTILALLGNSLAFTAYMLIVLLVFQSFIPEFFVGIVPALLAAGLVTTRLRWAPALGGVAVLLTSTIFLTTPDIQYHLTHPGDSPYSFIPIVVILACAFIVLLTGVAATFQPSSHVFPSMHATPQWLRPTLTTLSSIVVGMIIISLIVAANPQAGSATTTTNREPTVHMSSSTFVQNVVLVPKGSKVLMVNDTTVKHILQNGSWTPGGTIDATAEAGAPIVHTVGSTGGSLEIGPFNAAEVFHIYCTIHKGMNLTIVVQ
jgi:hypothetical protein